MVQVIARVALIAATGLLLGGCASGNTAKKVPGVAGGTNCEDPRPQICTMDYRPVCGAFNDGSTRTYSNGCGACADVNVTSWVENGCPE